MKPWAERGTCSRYAQRARSGLSIHYVVTFDLFPANVTCRSLESGGLSGSDRSLAERDSASQAAPRHVSNRLMRPAEARTIMAITMVDERHRAYLDACSECQQACEACAYDCCVTRPDLAECTRLCLDCATICAACVTLLARGSRWADELCQLCTQVAEACAAECAKHEDMDLCRQCVTACRACVEQCRAMASA